MGVMVLSLFSVNSHYIANESISVYLSTCSFYGQRWMVKTAKVGDRADSIFLSSICQMMKKVFKLRAHSNTLTKGHMYTHKHTHSLFTAKLPLESFKGYTGVEGHYTQTISNIYNGF